MFNKVKINGQPSVSDNSLSLHEFPLPIRKLMENNSNYTIKIREREYDIQVSDASCFNMLQAGLEMDQMSRVNPLPSRQIQELVKTIEPDDLVSIDSTSEDETLNGGSSFEFQEIVEAVAEPDTVAVEAKTKEKKIPKQKKKKTTKPISSSDSEEENSDPKLRFKPKHSRTKGITPKTLGEPNQKEKPSIGSAVTDLPTPELESSLEISPPLKVLTLDDISSGSSCEISGSDEEFFNRDKYQKIRESIKLKHKTKKLFERTLAMNCSKSPEENAPVADGNSSKQKLNKNDKRCQQTKDDNTSPLKIQRRQNN